MNRGASLYAFQLLDLALGILFICRLIFSFVIDVMIENVMNI